MNQSRTQFHERTADEKEILPGRRLNCAAAAGRKKIVCDDPALGAKDFIVKPYEQGNVLRAVQRLFEEISP